MNTTEKEVWTIYDYGYSGNATFKNVYIAPESFADSGEYICSVRVYKDNEAEDMRIAKLITAAPALLDALVGMLPENQDPAFDGAPDNHSVNRAKEAIAKTTK